MRRLSIVVTCTDRKALPPSPGLRARDLPTDPSVTVRADSWRRRMAQAMDNHLPLTDLYRGESWTQLPRLVRAAEQAGFRPRLWVASAGLGLRPVDSTAAPYAATFSTGHADSVTVGRADVASWWRQLGSLPGAVADPADLGRRVLWVLSESYGDALYADLFRTGTRGGELLLVGGSADITGITRLPADRALRPVLGGTATGLNTRTAVAWLQRLDGEPLTSRLAQKRWQDWVERVRQPERWDRRPQTDPQVLAFVRRLLRRDPRLTKTRALRLLRDSGLACEQKRFGDLFASVQEGLA